MPRVRAAGIRVQRTLPRLRQPRRRPRGQAPSAAGSGQLLSRGHPRPLHAPRGTRCQEGRLQRLRVEAGASQVAAVHVSGGRVPAVAATLQAQREPHTLGAVVLHGQTRHAQRQGAHRH